MNPIFPIEEPDFYTQALSPVSPKPAHLPSPSNIPILELQLDPSFSDNLNQSNPAFAPQNMDSNSHLHAGVDAFQRDQQATDASHSNDLDDGSQTPSTTPPTEQKPNDSAAEVVQVTQVDSAATPASDHHRAQPSYNTTHSEHQTQPVDTEMGGLENPGIDLDALWNDLSASSSMHPQVSNNETTTNESSYHNDNDNGNNNDKHSLPASALLATTATPLFAGAANLPPRPPPGDHTIKSEPLGDEYASYSAPHLTSLIPKYAPASAMPFVTSSLPALSLSTAGAPGTSHGANGLPPPPLATFQQASNGPSQLNESVELHEHLEEQVVKREEGGEVFWTPKMEEAYERFLQDEIAYEAQGNWDRFPTDSRLFVGNIPTEKVTKRDLFEVFHRYGKLAQISIKQAFGFVQFLDAATCARALKMEDGIAIRGRKIHLEASKPQSQTGNRKEGRASRTNRRSRTPPDYRLGGTGGNNGSGRADRYRGGNNNNNGNNRQHRRGDNHHPGRSPSPRRGSRDEYRGRDRSAERYNGRREGRSRSPRRGGNRMRSPELRHDVDLDDNLPFPRRAPQNVPEVQIIAVDGPNRDFVSMVERAFTGSRLSTNVLMLSPRLQIAAVLRRQIEERVVAVLVINQASQRTQKFELHIFNYDSGINYETYDNQPLQVCVALVINDRRKKEEARALMQAQQSVYDNPYGLPMQQPLLQQQMGLVPPPPQMPANNVLAGIDSNALKQLLVSMQPPPPQQHAQHPQQYMAAPNVPPAPSAADLSRILSQVSGGAQAPQMQNPAPYPSLVNNPAFAGLFGQPATPVQNAYQGHYDAGAQQHARPGHDAQIQGMGTLGQNQAQAQAQNQAQGQRGGGLPAGDGSPATPPVNMADIMAQLRTFGR